MSDRDRGRHAELRAFFSPAGFYELQGVLFAVASSPEEIAPQDWVPFVLDQLGRQRTGHAPGQRIAEGLTALYREIDDAVIAASVTLPASCAFREDLLANLAEDAPVSRWCLGFLRAHSWLEQCWELVPAGEMRDELGALHLTLGFFASRPLAERMVSEFTGPASTLEGAATVFRETFDDAMRRYAVLGRTVRHAVLEAGPEFGCFDRLPAADPEPLLATGSNEIIPQISPDGKWLAFLSDQAGPYQVRVRPFPDVERREWVVSGGGDAYDARWSPRGDAVLYRRGAHRVMSVSVGDGDELAPGVVQELIEIDFHDSAGSSFAISPEGKRLLVNKPVEPSILDATSLTLVTGWAGEVSRAVER